MTSLSGQRIKATQHSMNRQHNPFLFPDTTSEGRWEEKANCRGKAPELFEYHSDDSPHTQGMKFKERLEYNETNYLIASEFCIECPVMFICGAEASDEERRWTVRGGEKPTQVNADAVRYAQVGRPAKGGDRICQRGHRVKGGGRCKVCKQENGKLWLREYRARQKAADAVK